MQKNRILVATLNWGLGHTTRCIPIIKGLLKHDFTPILASDGEAGKLLQKEFPNLTYIELPSYNIRYSKTGKFLKWKLMLNSPKIISAIMAEKKLTETLVKTYDLAGIISDNRLGVRSKKLKKNIFITHQLNMMSGKTSLLSSYIHRNYIRKFEECWVPDLEGDNNLSGRLGHLRMKPPNVKYIGPLSRINCTNAPKVYDYLVLLSGPEPQRSILECILLKELRNSEDKILFVRGVISEKLPETDDNPNLTIQNYLYGSKLQEAMNCSEKIISRPGYTTLMDLAKLQKKAYFIPTPGQYEQEYLANRLNELKIAPCCHQDEFRKSKLEEIDEFSGLSDLGRSIAFGDLFAFFKSE